MSRDRERGTRVGGGMKPCNECEIIARTTHFIELITRCTYITRISGLLY